MLNICLSNSGLRKTRYIILYWSNAFLSTLPPTFLINAIINSIVAGNDISLITYPSFVILALITVLINNCFTKQSISSINSILLSITF